MKWRTLSKSALLGLAVVSLGWGQITPTALRISAQTETGSLFVNEGSSVPVFSDGRPASVVFSITNGGAGTITLNQLNVFGPEFFLTSGPSLPASLPPNGVLAFTVRYAPLSGTPSTAQVGLQYVENASLRTFPFSIVGNVPAFQFAVLNNNGSVTPIAPGGRITFLPTKIRTAQTLTLLVQNRGTATGSVNTASVLGNGFTVSAASLPASIRAGQDVPIQLSFTPQTRGPVSAVLNLGLSLPVPSLTLDGTGTTSEFVAAYALRTNQNFRPLANGGTVSFGQVAVDGTAIADLVIGNNGTAGGEVRSVSVTGADFKLAGLPLLPATVEPKQAVAFSIQFSPKQLGSSVGSLRIELEDMTINAVLDGSTALPQFSMSYIDTASTSILPVANGATLSFPATNVNATSDYTVILRNQGAGTGFVNNITVSGDAFQLTQLPSLRATVPANQELRFGVRFSPLQRQTYSGSMRIELADAVLSLNLSGPGVAPAFSYELIREGEQPVPVTPPSEISVTTPVGQRSPVVVRFINRGNTTANISSISISGTGWELSNTPFLPFTLQVDEMQQFTVAFAPTQPGVSRGRLRIGNDSFDLVGSAIGPRLAFSFANDAGTTTVDPGGIILLTPTRVGESQRVEITVQNTGTAPASISTIDLTPAAIFSIEGVPPLPFSLNAGSEMRFAVIFSPNNTGNQDGSLRVNTSTFLLSGNGRQPVALPPFRIEGPSGVQPPMQQPGYRLQLAQPYGLALKGVLTLSFFSEVFSANPAVQFATGGRTINFTIPANTTSAVFENGLQEVKLQTGTVAGTITLAPSFSTLANLDLTPASANPLSLSISRLAPRLLSLDISNRTQTGLQLVVSGFSTTRSLRQVDIELVPRNGEKFSATKLTLNTESAALAWFEGSQGQGSGGLFTFTIPLSLQRDANEDLVRFIQSISVTAQNEVGASNPLSVAVP